MDLLSVPQVSQVHPHRRTVSLVIPSAKSLLTRIFAECLLPLFRSHVRCHLLKEVFPSYLSTLVSGCSHFLLSS